MQTIKIALAGTRVSGIKKLLIHNISEKLPVSHDGGLIDRREITDDRFDVRILTYK